MNEIEFRLSEEQYKILIRFLYFADYYAWHGLISEFKDSEDRDILFNVIQKIYNLGDKLNLPKSISLTSVASEVRFTEEESLKRKQRVEHDLENIAKLVFANEFAKRDLNLPKNDWLFDREGRWETKDRLISERIRRYLKEFNENGISNLRFKMFYHLPYEEDDE
jgi:hypothetical protein